MILDHSAIDLVGDVHGMIETLQAMLDQLGYHRNEDRGWHHPEGRHLVSLGDLIDDGPAPLECLEMIADMARDGIATMLLGNHELNAVLYMHGLREHSDKNRKQFEKSLEQIEAEPGRWKRLEQFLHSCPTHLEVAGLRVIHACWHEPSIAHLPDVLDSDDSWERAANRDLQDVIENCIKGPEEDCEPVEDRAGHVRTKRRVEWWTDYRTQNPHVVFGHYALPWRKELAAHTEHLWLGPGRNAACLDYGAAKGGPLLALRWPEDEFVIQPNLDPLT